MLFSEGLANHYMTNLKGGLTRSNHQITVESVRPINPNRVLKLCF